MLTTKAKNKNSGHTRSKEGKRSCANTNDKVFAYTQGLLEARGYRNVECIGNGKFHFLHKCENSKGCPVIADVIIVKGKQKILDEEISLTKRFKNIEWEPNAKHKDSYDWIRRSAGRGEVIFSFGEKTKIALLEMRLKGELAIKFLVDNSYSDIEFLNNGGFSFVFKCKNPEGEKIAARVIVAESSRALNQEIDMNNNLESLDWNYESCENFESGDLISCFFQEPSFKQYANIGRVTVVSQEKMMAIFESPLMDGDISETEFTATDSFDDDESHKTVDYSELKRVASRVLKVLVVLNNNGLAHFDIKPQNILALRTPQGKSEYKVTDFGLGGDRDPRLKAWDPVPSCENGENSSVKLPKNARARGTKKYLAPELKPDSSEEKEALLGNLFQKADVYSLGLTLLELYIRQQREIWNRSEKYKYSTKNLNKYVDELQRGDFQAVSEDDETELEFLDFVKYITTIDPARRPSAAQALEHLLFIGGFYED